jgi:hypothetical protein
MNETLCLLQNDSAIWQGLHLSSRFRPDSELPTLPLPRTAVCPAIAAAV